MKIFALCKALLIALFCFSFLFDQDLFFHIDCTLCNKIMKEEKWLGSLCLGNKITYYIFIYSDKYLSTSWVTCLLFIINKESSRCNTNHKGYIRLHFHIWASFFFGFNRVGHFVFFHYGNRINNLSLITSSIPKGG